MSRLYLTLQLRNDGGNETELMARLFSTSLVTLLPAVSYSLKVIFTEKHVLMASKSTYLTNTLAAQLNPSSKTPRNLQDLLLL